uniref:NADH dehydrogenase [ubiquinone] 1 subunit C2 n=1 Tax=Pseudonaja textilis TaxID=8673 RepID=A0A670ZHS6_PSETE
MAGVFWLSALLDNGLNRRPILRAGVHRQVLMTTLGFCLGYYIKRYSNYYYAERDRELFSYIKHHPEDFVEKGTLAGSAFQERGSKVMPPQVRERKAAAFWGRGRGPRCSS